MLRIGKYYNALDIESFSQMMKDPSYCYKFYWLEAIVNLISEGIQDTTFDTIINEMICNAWYSVREFHIHLSGMQADGLVRDGLERAVLKLTGLSNLPANASKVEIKNAIAEYNAELKASKEQLTNMVPGRALAGFFTKSDEEVPWGSVRRLTEYIRRIDSTLIRLPKWDPFFERFAENQYVMYGLIHEKESIHKLYECCFRDNLHSIWAGQELYRKGNSREEFYNILQKNMQPVYDSARRQGYEVWNF